LSIRCLILFYCYHRKGRSAIKGERKRLENRLHSFQESAPEADSWVICPVCHQPNITGTRFCEHCWGAMIHSDSPVLSFEEMKETVTKRVAYLKRRWTIKISVISAVSAIVLTAILYPTLYFSTGVLFKPPKDLNSNSPPGQWTMFRHDIERSGGADSVSTVPQGTIKWVFPTDGAIHSSPAVANGTVYFGSQDSKLYALDAKTGDKLWEFETGSWVESSPAIADGVVYFGSNDGNMYAVDAETGETIWVFETAYPIISSPAVAGDMIYFGADDYYIYALDASDGTEIWKFYTGSHVTSSPAVLNGIVYIGTNGNYLYTLHAIDGRRILRFKSHYPGFSSPALSNDTIYFSGSSGRVYAVDADARSWPREHEFRPMWTQIYAWGLPGIPAPPLQSGFLWQLRISRSATTSPAIVGSNLYVGTGEKLIVINLESQEKVWEFETGDSVWSSPAVINNYVYFGSDDHRLYAIDAITGEEAWHISTEGKITSSPAVADGIIYIGSHDGKLYAIE